ncbi:MAG TPA: ferritin-like domain-containing protein [Aggregatilineaceae bacterium]|nr:ferritin-like domain-containing protein [Aggregatilineaceae bacterium]
MALKSLQDFLVDELKDLYDAEHQITKALPKMQKVASSDKLKTAFEEHLTQTENQIDRLEQAFEHLGKKATRKHCKGVEGLISEGDELIKEGGDPDTVDAALIAAAQKVEHYEMASYGSARTYAQILGMDEVAELLQATLDEEGATDKKLTQIAKNVNVKAMR